MHAAHVEQARAVPEHEATRRALLRPAANAFDNDELENIANGQSWVDGIGFGYDPAPVLKKLGLTPIAPITAEADPSNPCIPRVARRPEVLSMGPSEGDRAEYSPESPTWAPMRDGPVASAAAWPAILPALADQLDISMSSTFLRLSFSALSLLSSSGPARNTVRRISWGP